MQPTQRIQIEGKDFPFPTETEFLSWWGFNEHRRQQFLEKGGYELLTEKQKTKTAQAADLYVELQVMRKHHGILAVCPYCQSKDERITIPADSWILTFDNTVMIEFRERHTCFECETPLGFAYWVFHQSLWYMAPPLF